MFARPAKPEPGYFRRRDAEFTEVSSLLISGKMPESKKKPVTAVYLFLPVFYAENYCFFVFLNFFCISGD
jgi:hypothetical protein